MELGNASRWLYDRGWPLVLINCVLLADCLYPPVLVSRPVLSVVGATLVLGKRFQLLCRSDDGTLPIIYSLHGPEGLIGRRAVSKPGEQAIFNSSAIFKSTQLNNFMCHAKNSQHKPPMVGSVLQLLHSTNIIGV